MVDVGDDIWEAAIRLAMDFFRNLNTHRRNRTPLTKRVKDKVSKLKAKGIKSTDTEIQNTHLEECSEIGEDTPAVAFKQGAEDNLHFDFETVEWDKKASLLCNSFDNARIAYSKTDKSDNTVHFEIPSTHALAALNVINSLCENVKGFNSERFSNLSEIETRAEQTIRENDQLLSYSFENKEQAEIIKNILGSAGVSYEAAFSKETNTENIMFSKNDYETHAQEIDKAIQNFNIDALKTQNKTETIALNRAKESIGKKINNIRADEQRFGVDKKKVTPAMDEKIATRSAQAQNQNKSHERNKTRGAI